MQGPCGQTCFDDAVNVEKTQGTARRVSNEWRELMHEGALPVRELKCTSHYVFSGCAHARSFTRDRISGIGVLVGTRPNVFRVIVWPLSRSVGPLFALHHYIRTGIARLSPSAVLLSILVSPTPSQVCICADIIADRSVKSLRTVAKARDASRIRR